MRELEHTPGPLRAMKEGPFYTIVPVNGGPEIGQILKKSDAKLYAAAPEMLDALISSCNLFESYKDLHYRKNGIGSHKYQRNKKQFDLLKSIIESATGKTWEDLKRG